MGRMWLGRRSAGELRAAEFVAVFRNHVQLAAEAEPEPIGGGGEHERGAWEFSGRVFAVEVGEFLRGTHGAAGEGMELLGIDAPVSVAFGGEIERVAVVGEVRAGAFGDLEPFGRGDGFGAAEWGEEDAHAAFGIVGGEGDPLPID